MSFTEHNLSAWKVVDNCGWNFENAYTGLANSVNTCSVAGPQRHWGLCTVSATKDSQCEAHNRHQDVPLSCNTAIYFLTPCTVTTTLRDPVNRKEWRPFTYFPFFAYTTITASIHWHAKASTYQIGKWKNLWTKERLVVVALIKSASPFHESNVSRLCRVEGKAQMMFFARADHMVRLIVCACACVRVCVCVIKCSQ